MKKALWIGLCSVLTVGLAAPETGAEPAPIVKQAAPSQKTSSEHRAALNALSRSILLLRAEARQVNAFPCTWYGKAVGCQTVAAKLKAHVASADAQLAKLVVLYKAGNANVLHQQATNAKLKLASAKVALTSLGAAKDAVELDAARAALAAVWGGAKGFENPIIGFEDPTFAKSPLGFENPIIGFENPIIGFEDPTFNRPSLITFENPIIGFEARLSVYRQLVGASSFKLATPLLAGLKADLQVALKSVGTARGKSKGLKAADSVAAKLSKLEAKLKLLQTSVLALGVATEAKAPAELGKVEALLKDTKLELKSLEGLSQEALASP